MKKNTVLEESELKDMLERAGRPLHLDDILRIGRYSRKVKGGILACLGSLADSGCALRMRGGGWSAVSTLKRCRGRLAAQRSGAAFVRPEDGSSKDIFIAAEDTGGAWNGDTVEVLILPRGKTRQGAPEGRVLSVVERGCTEIACRVLRRADKGRFFCQPADARMILDILADADGLDHVPEPFEILRIAPLERLERLPGRRPLWSGKVLSSLGPESGPAAQERLVKLGSGIPAEFPDNVLAEAEEVSQKVTAEGLEDLRAELLVTIDGEDARDFDDAVCVSRCRDGWRLLVAIADVSAYVRPHTALDREARERGNSFYFPLSVEPMLPEALCNGACSLRPGEDRRCLAAEMTLDENGGFCGTRFCNAVMASRARLTYRQVQDILDDPHGSAAAELERDAPGVPAMLIDAQKLAERLILRRRRMGGLDFDVPEAEYVTGEKDGIRTVEGMRCRERLFSHRLIEAFMVRANEAVAEFLSKKGVPFLYRTHPDPGAERLCSLAQTLQALCPGLPLPRPAEAADPKWMPVLLEAAAGTDSRSIVNSLMLRSMMQARYGTEKDRHFGLASACYCHFTSPIRRYADLENHRALKRALGLERDGAEKRALDESAAQCNRQERTAAAAERETQRRMGCLLLEPRVGEIFQGVVSAATSFGIFVELDGMPVEGMVRIEDLPQDWYDFDEERMELRGRFGGTVFRPGQRMNVKLSGVNVGRMEIDLEIQDNENGRGNGGNGKKKPDFRKRTEGHGKRREFGRAAFARRKPGFREDRDRRFARSDGEGSFREEREDGFRKKRPWKDRDDRAGFADRRSFRRDDDSFGGGEEHGRFRPRREGGDRDLRRRDGGFAGREGGERGDKPFRRDGGRRFSGRPFRRDDERSFGGEEHGRFRPRRNDGDRDLRRRDDGFAGREGGEREERRFREKDGRRRSFGRFHDEGRGGSRFRNDRGEREGFREKKPSDHSQGAADDIFRIEIDEEKKPVFRFGRRGK